MAYPLFSDEYFMNEALREAGKALEKDEVPVGAVVVFDKTVIARAHNMTEELNDVTAHAEMIAITSAANYLGSKFLNGCTLYVTLEPCAMCASATNFAHIERIVFAATDPKVGYSVYSEKLLHPRTIVSRGILKKESEVLLDLFFRDKRKK
jgi:tRNA(adenine34) deaminase